MYTIEQKTEYQWEPIPNGEFSNVEDAVAAASDLIESLDWDNLRIIGNGELHLYGLMPNTNITDWYFAGYID